MAGEGGPSWARTSANWLLKFQVIRSSGSEYRSQRKNEMGNLGAEI
jgi:hypothetical protein